jgi:cell division protein FtsW
MLFLAGARLGPILGTVLGVALAAALAIVSSSWRRARIEAFLDPFAHRAGSGYQIVESMLAFGSGGLTGVGIGDSRQKLFFLPEAHTDFISAIIGEELGFVGMTIVVGAFALLIVRGLRTAWNAPDEYGTYLATGATLLIGMSAFTNLAVAMGLVPTKGLVLPFLSYGGSALVVDAAAIGVILNVSRQCVTKRATEIPGQSRDASPKARTPRARGAQTDPSGPVAVGEAVGGSS